MVPCDTDLQRMSDQALVSLWRRRPGSPVTPAGASTTVRLKDVGPQERQLLERLWEESHGQ